MQKQHLITICALIGGFLIGQYVAKPENIDAKDWKAEYQAKQYELEQVVKKYNEPNIVQELDIDGDGVKETAVTTQYKLPLYITKIVDKDNKQFCPNCEWFHAKGAFSFNEKEKMVYISSPKDFEVPLYGGQYEYKDDNIVEIQ
ncbi:MAG: hypothetical protein M3Q81_04455 [bacterium]|nr:hypothetical protein [bacterium]